MTNNFEVPSTPIDTIPPEWAVNICHRGPDGELISEVMDARFTEEQIDAINTELVRRGHLPTMSQTTLEQVAQLQNLAPFPPRESVGQALRHTMGKFLGRIVSKN